MMHLLSHLMLLNRIYQLVGRAQIVFTDGVIDPCCDGTVERTRGNM